jgi:hypothetical protein
MSQELVPTGDKLWDSEVRDILKQVVYFARPKNGKPHSKEVRRMIAIDAAGRLEGLVDDLEGRIGFVPAPPVVPRRERVS